MDDKLIVGQREAIARALYDSRPHCDLCAGKCRGHSVGRPEEWEPETGSKATPTPVSAAVEERAKPYVLRNEPGHRDSGGKVVAPFVNDDEMRAITAALTNAQPIRAGLTQRAMMQRINEAIRMLDWCIENHYAPDSSREVAAVAGLREVKKSFPAALATPDDALTVDCDAIAEAIGKADDAFGYSFNMTMLVDGIATYTLTMDGFDSVDFEDRDDGYRLIAERRNQARATAIRALLTRAPGQGGAA